MNSMKRSLLWTVICTGVLLGTLAAPATRLMATPQDPTPAPDNTKVNKGDQSSGAPTADQQKENPSDRETTRQIRRSLIKDRSLSMYAHNVKIITQNGFVTLRGPVRSDDEKQAVEAKAKEVAGADKVTSELEVKPKS